jgi:hypothetical protein
MLIKHDLIKQKKSLGILVLRLLDDDRNYKKQTNKTIFTKSETAQYGNNDLRFRSKFNKDTVQISSVLFVKNKEIKSFVFYENKKIPEVSPA